MQETEDLKQHLQISKQRKLTLLAEVQYAFLFIRICRPSMSIEFSLIDYCFYVIQIFESKAEVSYQKSSANCQLRETSSS